MSDTLIAVKPEIAAKALVGAAQYKDMYASASADPAAFWSGVAAHHLDARAGKNLER